MIETSGEWREARLYVLQTIEDLKKEAREAEVAAAVERVSKIDKAEKDIKMAHDKIRKLETAGSWLKTKNYLMTAAISVGGAIAYEYIRTWIQHSKP